jgi:methylase of polypeptide subunit release factors
VAAHLGYKYTGVEIRPEQSESNREQAREIGVAPVWIDGDGRDVDKLITEPADFIMCCPPYADLEVYSDDPRDLSTMEYDEFLTVYRDIIANSLRVLKQDRFACFVVGDVRDKRGVYRNFPAATTRAFVDAGAELYNEAVLVTAIGSLPIRVGRQFEAARKLGKTHQNVLIYVKGDPRKATAACGPVETWMPEEGNGQL